MEKIQQDSRRDGQIVCFLLYSGLSLDEIQMR